MPSSREIRAGAAYVELYAGDNRLVRGLNRAQKRLKAFGALVQGMGARMLAVGGLLASPLALTVKAASDMEETMNKFNVVFGDNAQAVKDWGDTFGAEVGRSQQQVADFLAGTQDLLIPIGFEPGAATEMSKQLTGLAVDLASFNNKADADVLRDLHAALTGSSEVMKKYGVIVNETAVKQELLNQGLDANKVTELQKVTARWAIILRGTTAAQGDAIRSAGSFANQIKALKANIQDTAVEVGTALLPVITPIVTQISQAVKVVAKWAQSNRELVVTVLKATAAIVAGGVALVAVGAAISGLGAILGAITATLAAVGTAVGLVGSALAGLLSPIGLVIAAVTGLAAYLLQATGVGGEALEWLSEKFGAFKDTALASYQAIADALAAGDISLAAKILWLALKAEWQRGVHFLSGLWLKFKDFFLSVTSQATFGVARVLIDGWAAIETGWLETIHFLADAWALFTDTLTKTWHQAVGFIRKAWVRLKSLFDEDINVEAEVETINRDVAQRTEATERQTLEQIGRREDQRQQQRAEIAARAAETQQTLGQMQAAEQDAREQQFARDLADSEARLADARRQWRQAVAAASERRTAMADSEPNRLRRLQDQLAQSATAVRDVEAATSKGTFSAFGVRGLGADSLAERTARATEEVVTNTRRLVDQAKQGRLVFTP